MQSIAPFHTQIEPGWAAVLCEEFDKPYFLQLQEFLRSQIERGEEFFPPPADIFRAFSLTPFDHVKVVLIGQDPYHGAGQAHGLSFSVRDGVGIPPSLANIFAELQADVGCMPKGGNLEGWARQGVLLLNTILTVQPGAAGSHRGRGWEQFTDAVVSALDHGHEGLVFLLWGRHAQAKGARIDATRHHVLTAPHPSPLAARSGFFGCRHFSRCNELLLAQGRVPIDWARSES